MVGVNKHFLKIKQSYLFSQIEERLELARNKLGSENIINLGIGDICHPICPTVKAAFIEAINEMSTNSSIKGYGPALGYPFLRQAFCQKYYSDFGLTPDEIFITDGINSPITQILDVFDSNCSIGIPNPAYPVYLDNAIMKGFSDNLHTLSLLQENNFNAVPPSTKIDIVYLCSPGNPTGTAMNFDELKAWVDWANKHNSIILFDAAYSCFIHDSNIPSSIFEIEGAKNCCIEFSSFSKSAGFTGLRLGCVAISKHIQSSLKTSIYTLFKQYLETVSNGVSYPVQRAGLAALAPQAQTQINADIMHYKLAAKTLKQTLLEANYTVFGGKNSPYLWVKVNEDLSCQDYCYNLLEQGLVCIAGSGFGSCGSGFFRLSCFVNQKTLDKAVQFFKKGRVYNEDTKRVLTL